MSSPRPRRPAALMILALAATACGRNDQRRSDDGVTAGLAADSFVAQHPAISTDHASGADAALLHASPERRETSTPYAGIVIGGTSSGFALTNDAVQPTGAAPGPMAVPVRDPASAVEPTYVPPSGGSSGGGGTPIVTPPTRSPVAPSPPPPQPAPETPVIIISEPSTPQATPTPTPTGTGARPPRGPRTPPVVPAPSPGVSDTAPRPSCGGAGTSDTVSRALCGPGTSDTAGAARRTQTRTGVMRGGAIIPLIPAAGGTTPATAKAKEGAKGKVPEGVRAPRRPFTVQGVRRP